MSDKNDGKMVIHGVLFILLIIFILISLFLEEAAAGEYKPGFVRRSLDKTIVVTPRQTITIPGAEGQGTKVITIDNDKRYGDNYDGDYKRRYKDKP